MSAYAELIMDQGATFGITITLDDEDTSAPMNAVGYTATSSLRKSYYSANVSANLVCTFSDAANGELTLSLPAANTANLESDKYLFDVKTTSPSGVVSRILEGVIIVTPQITTG